MRGRRLLTMLILMGAAMAASAQTLTVGTRIAPPFVMENEAGELTGISITLWERLADDLSLDFQYRRTNLDGLLDGLQDGSLDVAVGALTMTAERERILDFTHPFHTSGLAVATRPGGAGIMTSLKRFVSHEFLLAVLGLLALLLAVGVIVWLAERRANAEEFGGSAAQGLGNGLWWAAVTMTTVGYGDKSPRTLAGRLVGLIWMFAAIILISGFTAAIATSLTVGQLDDQIRNVDDLHTARVVTVERATSGNALRHRGIDFRPVDGVETGLAALVAGDADAVVYDAPILRYQVNHAYPGRATVAPFRFENQEYALALPSGSELRERMNQRILEIVNDPGWSDVVTEFLGDD